MKTVFIAIILSLTSYLLKGQSFQNDTALYKSDHYNKRIALFKKDPILEGRVIFLGNSITEFGDWKNLLADSTVINRGIAGDNTYGVLARLNDIIIRKPQKLFIEIGINDYALKLGQQHVVRNILSIVKQVRIGSPQTKIYVISILPTNDNVKKNYPFAYNKARQTAILNDNLLKVVSFNSFYFVNLNAVFKNSEGKLDSRYAMHDGIHLNKSGYHLWYIFLKSKGLI